MQGGEIFVPKIPSVKISDVVEAIGPGMEIETVGIRPGEKLHETMCPRDDSHLTYEFDDHFVIKPTIQFNRLVRFEKNMLGEVGRPVEEGFAYNSGSNFAFLSVN